MRMRMRMWTERRSDWLLSRKARCGYVIYSELGGTSGYASLLALVAPDGTEEGNIWHAWVCDRHTEGYIRGFD